MNYLRTFNSAEEARDFKKHVLSVADTVKHTYMIVVNKQLSTFSTSTIADKIILESNDKDSDEYKIISALIEGKLLGDGFDYNTDRIITESELKNVTSLGDVFAGNISGKSLNPSKYQINDFSSFKYFTGIESIEGMSNSIYKNLFGQLNLKVIDIPVSVKEIGNSAFAFCVSLTDIHMHNEITAIKTKAFYNCTALEEIEIPASVTVIENNAFNKCENLTSITFKSNVPCKVYKDTFTGISDDCEICVPAASLEAYKSQWKYVENFRAI